MKILIVDDDPVLRQILQTYLLRAGYEVALAEDGRVAWEMWQKEHTRLIITDWMMPVMDGPELIRRVRSASFPYYTYIIMLTAKEGKSDVIFGLEAGADDYLTKPFNAGELRARIAIGERILNLEANLNQALARMEELATHDPVTGLLNRRALYTHAEAELNRAQRNRKPLSLVMLDIDHFKQVNDQHGHLLGDKALHAVATTLAQNKRPYDWAGRWGGEEFLLVLPATDSQEAALVAERLRVGIQEMRVPLPDGGAISVQASLGVSTFEPGSAHTLDLLVHQADEALMRAKREGRNCVCVFDPNAAVVTT
ncbi:MAG: diguanylate cyclase [Anaerolineales bacterium]|nr:diguanylate cyclase [Anaerolineales bacterium]